MSVCFFIFSSPSGGIGVYLPVSNRSAASRTTLLSSACKAGAISPQVVQTGIHTATRGSQLGCPAQSLPRGCLVPGEHKSFLDTCPSCSFLESPRFGIKGGLRRQLTVRRFGYVSRLGTSVTGMPVTDFSPHCPASCEPSPPQEGQIS